MNDTNENVVSEEPENETPTHDAEAAAESVTPAALVDGEMPDPSPHVVDKYVTPDKKDEQPEGPAQEAPVVEQKPKSFRDKAGESFDPAKHQHRSGEPELTPKGYLKRWGSKQQKVGLPQKPEGLGKAEETDASKRSSFWDKAKKAVGIEREKEIESEPEGGSKTDDGAPEKSPNGGFVGRPPTAPDAGKPKSSEAANAAEQLVAMEEMIAVMVFSEEWQFLSEERKGLVMAWTRAFEEKGIVETPWWMELGAAHAVIVASRAEKPKTRERMGKMKAALQKRIIDFRSAKSPKEQRKEVESE